MVVEHLDDPLLQFAEIKRVLKRGGIFTFHTPNYYSPLVFMASLTPERLKRNLIKIIEGRAQEDIFPTYYRVNTERSIRQIAQELGFAVQEIKLVTSGGHAVFALCPPISVMELLYIKTIKRYHLLRHLRGNIIAVLRKPGAA
jgi:SAM-dependent methyltransferase